MIPDFRRLKLNGLFNIVFHSFNATYSAVWDFITMDGINWDGNDLNFFIDKAFDILAPGESTIPCKYLPSNSNPGQEPGLENPSFPLPRRKRIQSILEDPNMGTQDGIIGINSSVFCWLYPKLKHADSDHEARREHALKYADAHTETKVTLKDFDRLLERQG